MCGIVQGILYLGSNVTKKASPVAANLSISGLVIHEQGRELTELLEGR